MKKTHLFRRNLTALFVCAFIATSCAGPTTSTDSSTTNSDSITYYTVTWKNHDGTTLEVDSDIPYGTIPSFDGPTPTRIADAQYSYTFSGWSPSVVEVISDATYTAHYSESVNSYTITWQNYDGTVLETDTNVPYGTMPTYDGTTPTRTDGIVYIYSFNGWTPEVVSVRGNQTYVARFEESQGSHQFGSYPQSLVTDEGLVSTLTTAAGALPSSGNNQLWTDYGYYISRSVSSYMWYIDIANSENEYRGVYFTSYRPGLTTIAPSLEFTYQDDYGYETSTVYWFKYEPITWRVLDVQSDKAFLLTDLVLDSQDYHYSTDDRTIGESTIYPNNYEHSHIRTWLNENFYNTAFNTEEKASIITTNVDNSVASTGFVTNEYACTDTDDKVFLLSYVEAMNENYGLSATSRQLMPSAYAQSQGSRLYWWLRSPRFDRTERSLYVNSSGSIDYTRVGCTDYGVVPAMWISL